MNVETPIETVVQQLANAVDLTMNPSMSQEKRHEAYRLCDSFKNEFPLCIQCQCALYFTSDNAPYTDIVRHFGLQLMEHCIKFRWYQMGQEDKLLIKNTIMSLVNSATPALQTNYLKDALARVVVEMIKREWPQHWPGMLNELEYATTLGFCQTETVMLIFLRLIEDVILLQTIDNAARRRDISKELQQSMSKIFPFFINVIDIHCRQYLEYLRRNEQNSTTTTLIRVIQLALVNVGELFEFIQLSHVNFKDCYIITVLCSLLDDFNFKQQAIDCLSILLTRKSKNEERECVMKLFDQPLQQLSMVVLKAIGQEANDENNIFLKTLSKVVSMLSSVLCAFWKDNKLHNYSVEESEKILLYYAELIHVCLGHDSLNVITNINQAWCTLFKHNEISKNILLQQNYIPKWFLLSSKKLIKVDYKNLDSFTLLDFTDEESYNTVFYHTRAEIVETIRYASAVENSIMFSVTENLLKSCIEKSSTRMKVIPICEPDSAEFLEWEVVILILDGVVSKLSLNPDSEIVRRGLKLIELCLKFDTNDPLILSFLLSSVSALFVFLTATSWPSEYLHATLNKMYEYLILECHPDDQLYVPIKDLRFHSASLFIKLSVKFPNLLLPVFDKLCSLSDQLLLKTSKTFDHLNICLRLQEALLVLNNHVPDYEKQAQLITHILEPCQLMWQKVQSIVTGGPEELLAYLGLDRPPVDLDSDPCLENRNHLTHCVNVLTSVMTRSNTNSSLSKIPVLSPVSEPVLLLLPNVFLLIKNLNSLCSDNVKKMMHPSYLTVLQIFPQEREALLGKNTVSEKNDPFQMFRKKPKPDPVHKIKYSILGVYENCLLVLGKSCQLLGERFYALQNFAPSFIATIMSDADSLPHVRIRIVMKSFIKPFLINCSSKYYDTVLIPIINSFMSHMLIRLSFTWQNIPEREEYYDTKEGDTEDLLEDMMIRLLTREYLDLIRLCLTSSNDSKTSPHGSVEEIPIHQANNDLSELGMKLLRNEQSRRLIVESILNGLSWNSTISQFWKTCQIFQWDNRPVLPPWSDSQSSFKATILVQLIVKHLAMEDERTAMTIAPDLLIAVLESLHWFGHHDSNMGPLLATCLNVYETFRNKNDQLLGVFRKLPEINLETLERFDRWVMSNDILNNKVNKGKREMLKKILAGCIGKDVSQTHKRKAELRDLPKIHNLKISTSDLLENGDDLNINRLQN